MAISGEECIIRGNVPGRNRLDFFAPLFWSSKKVERVIAGKTVKLEGCFR